jgi:hypothetical protein
MPDNKGEVRESLKILEKVGNYEGLLSMVASDKDVSKTLEKFIKRFIDWYYW